MSEPTIDLAALHADIRAMWPVPGDAHVLVLPETLAALVEVVEAAHNAYPHFRATGYLAMELGDALAKFSFNTPKEVNT